MTGRQEVLEYLINEIAEICNEPEIGEKTELLNGNYLNSISILYIVSEIEEHYEIEIPIEDINVSNFRSIETITDLVVSLINRSFLIEKGLLV